VTTGIVLRSEVVGGWPAMTVNALDKDHQPLTCRRISRNILLVLFQGVIETISFSLPKEAVHLDLRGKSEDWLKSVENSADLARSLLKEQAEVKFTAPAT
jgi:hypothetical protein